MILATPASAQVAPAPTKQEGPGYYPLPIIGEIGVEVTGEALDSALKEARRVKPDYVVLIFDTNGGLVSERDRIIEFTIVKI